MTISNILYLSHDTAVIWWHKVISEKLYDHTFHNTSLLVHNDIKQSLTRSFTAEISSTFKAIKQLYDKQILTFMVTSYKI